MFISEDVAKVFKTKQNITFMFISHYYVIAYIIILIRVRNYVLSLYHVKELYLPVHLHKVLIASRLGDPNL